MWSLVWWPHAILNGVNPFVPDVVWAPEGANLTQGGFAIPAASVALAPITLTAGPVVAYNVISLVLPILAAWFAYRLCRYLTGAFASSLIGGLIFGFGTYMAAHLLGHLNLVSVFLVPAAVHVVLLRLDEVISQRRFVVLMTVMFALQLLLSAELLVMALGLGALALVLGYLTSVQERRRSIVRIVLPTLAAGAIAMLVTSPYLYWTLNGLGESDSEWWRNFTGGYTADALNAVVPTEVTGIGHWWFKGMSSTFTLGTPSEATGYVGPILLGIVLAFAITHWGQPATRVLVGVLVVSYVLSLGTRLHIAGHETGIPLPWAPLHRLPVLGYTICTRITVFGFLALAIMVALWLAEPSARGGLKWALVVAGVALLVPNLSASFWRGRPTNPPFFTSDTYRTYLKKDEIVLAFPYGASGSSMLWQAETGMHFRMVEGYVSPEPPPDYRHDPFLTRTVRAQFGEGSVRGLREFMVRRKVTTVLIEAGNQGPWPLLLGAMRLHPVKADGVLVYRVPGSWSRS